jgi:hypothetical protein
LKLLRVVLVLFVLAFTACHKSDDSPTNPSALQKMLSLTAYGSSLDTSYFKVWSDSSWEKYSKVRNVNGIDYLVTVTSAGNTYYYGKSGYAGLQPSGMSLILFDTPLQLPSTIPFKQSIKIQTTFYADSYNYTLVYDYYLNDTVNVSVPFGSFTGCAWFTVNMTLSAGGQSQSQSTDTYMAVGPSTIKTVSSNGSAVVMVRGNVNGRSWGMSLAKVTAQSSGRSNLIQQDVLVDLLAGGIRLFGVP